MPGRTRSGNTGRGDADVLTYINPFPPRALYKGRMNNHVFISFEFNRPDRTYDRVVFVVKSLGETWAEVHFAHWYVNTSLSAHEVCDRLKPVLSDNDKLVVIDATNNKAAWVNLGVDAANHLRGQGF